MNDMPYHCKKLIRKSFSRYASSYEQYAFVQKEIEGRLLDRCILQGPMPKRILDLGSGPGTSTKSLKQKFPGAKIVSLDIAWGMLKEAQKGFLKPIFKPSSLVQGDMESIPFVSNAFDMIFSNCALQWSNDLTQLFEQIKRVLKPGGTFFFSTFGPQTLFELKAIWQEVDPHPHVHDFCELQLIGDTLLKSGLTRPVVSSEHLKVTYRALQQLLNDLKYTGASNISPNRRKGLTPVSRLKKLNDAFDKAKNEQNLFNCSWEIIYGHAMKSENVFKPKAQPLHLVK